MFSCTWSAKPVFGFSPRFFHFRTLSADWRRLMTSSLSAILLITIPGLFVDRRGLRYQFYFFLACLV